MAIAIINLANKLHSLLQLKQKLNTHITQRRLISDPKYCQACQKASSAHYTTWSTWNTNFDQLHTHLKHLLAGTHPNICTNLVSPEPIVHWLYFWCWWTDGI